MRRDRRIRRITIALAVLALLIGISQIPLPYVTLAPAPTYDTLGRGPDGTALIRITGHPTYPSKGRLDLTMVATRGGPGPRMTLFEVVRAWLDPASAVYPERYFLQTESASPEQARQAEIAKLDQTKQIATTVALRQLHIPVAVAVTVTATRPGMPAASRLKAGDQIVSVDGHRVTALADIGRYFDRHAPGDSVVLDVRRDGTRSRVVVPTVRGSDGTPVVGITLTERYHYPFTVDIHMENVGGTSAGLMFALGIMDELTPEDLTGGRHIAGTGEIDIAGTVHGIGGITQKIIGARRAGATVFLAPATNCAEARHARSKGMQIVRVDSVTAALNALDSLRAGRPVPLC